MQNSNFFSKTSVQISKTPNKAAVRVFHSSVAEALGHKAAVVLQQILYLQCIKSMKYGTSLEETLVYNTYKQLHCDHFAFFSVRTLMRIIKTLEEEGLLISIQPYSKYGNKTKHYSVNIELFKKMFGEPNCLKKARELINQSKIKSHIKFFDNEKKEPCNYSQNGNAYCQNGNIIYLTETTNKDISSSIFNTVKEKNSEENFSFFERENEYGLEHPVPIPNKEEVDKIHRMLKDEFDVVHKYAVKPIKMYLNLKTKRLLSRLWYGSVLGQDIEKWRQLVIAANRSKFVMGEKKTEKDFKANAVWILREDVAIALLNGEYGVGDRELDRDNVVNNVVLMENEIVNTVSKQITNYLASNVEINKERKEFEEYIDDCINKRNEDKEDRYGMKFEFENYRVVWTIKARGGLLSEKESRQVESAFRDRYLSKKHLGKTKYEVKKELIKRIEKAKEDIGSESELLCRLKGLMSEMQVQREDSNQNGFSLIKEPN